MHALLPRSLPSELAVLADLALDLRWTWSHAADELFANIDAETWGRTGNPWFILQNVSQARLEQLAQTPELRAELERRAQERSRYLEGRTWCDDHTPALSGRRVAYFCMEFGLSDAIPLYAGGLGILAGDYLKTASDLGVPVVGVGVLFQEGYFRQVIDPTGKQREAYPYNDSTTLPIQPVIGPEGGWLRISIDLPGRALWLRVWRANVGRVPLLLLDANDPRNRPTDRAITSKLYGGYGETRLLQELVLGIGGWRALEALGLEAPIAHLNEGHAAFVVLERARRAMAKLGLGFREALWATRAGNVFTTHTPLGGGFDAFSPELVSLYFPPFGAYLSELGISLGELLALGRVDASDDREPLNMAYLAMRGSAYANGVSRLHGDVSRRLFTRLFPRWPERDVPIDHVTNGVHVPSWDSSAADELWTRACGKARWLGETAPLVEPMATIPDADLWSLRSRDRAALVDFARARLALHLAGRGVSSGASDEAAHVLDPHVLTIGFARRFAEYKRPTLLLRDPDRLARILLHAERPVQLLVAGKAHPGDEVGKQMVAEWIAFVRRTDVRRRAVFLEDYDMTLAAQMVRGVDVWLNTPRPPWEACGTSGMKVLVNGGLNVSTLDGWWAEAFTPDVGWAVGDATATASDERDADALFAVLERQVIPEFYARTDGVPRKWLDRMRASMSRLAPQFSCNRMVHEYVERAYRPALVAFDERVAEGARVARELAAWEADLSLRWAHVRFGRLDAHVEGDDRCFSIEVELGGLDAEAVEVALVADPSGEHPPELRSMQLASDAGAEGVHVYSARFATTRPISDYTPRAVPRRPGVRLPFELSAITWAR